MGVSWRRCPAARKLSYARELRRPRTGTTPTDSGRETSLLRRPRPSHVHDLGLGGAECSGRPLAARPLRGEGLAPLLCASAPPQAPDIC